jgi:anti-sigma B factor antagonist
MRPDFDTDVPATAPLTINATVAGSRVRLIVAGEIDMSNADRLRQCAFCHLDGPTARHVVADLARLTFIDASGLRALVRSRRHADELGKTFTVENHCAQVSLVIGAVELTDYLTDPTHNPAHQKCG